MEYFSSKSKTKLQILFAGLLIAVLVVACQGTSGSPSSDMQPSVDCRTVEHAFGQVCVPTDSQKLISLGDMTLANALVLGVKPIGASLIDGQLPSYLADYVSQIELLGKSEQPSLEKIVQLKPDLIIGIEPFGELILRQLADIAPTALGHWHGFPAWREHFDFVANVLGQEDKATQVWESYAQKIGEIQTALGKQLQNIEVSVVYVCCGRITIDAENSFAGSILSDIGIRRPEGHAAVDRGIIPLSKEILPEMDADVLFVSVYDTDSAKVFADWQKHPLWNQLRAVQKGQIYAVDYDVWRGGNPIAANLMIDDLFKYLVDEKA